ncbi:MAG: hypothetical protein AAGC47_07550 [Bacteroidota bacterium]
MSELLDLSNHQLMQHVVAFYQKVFGENQTAANFLKKKALLHERAVVDFEIGYADRSLGLTLPDPDNAKGKAIRKQLKEIGIYRKTGQEHFRGCVVFPIRNELGGVVQIYGRRLTSTSRGVSRNLFLHEQMCGVWNREALTNSDSWTLTTDLFDALKIWLTGKAAVTCCFGESLYPELIEFIKAQQPKQIDCSTAVLAEQVKALGISTGAESEAVAIPEVATKREPLLKAEKEQPETPSSTVNENEAHFTFASRNYRIRGLEKNTSFEVLKVNIRLMVGDQFHFDGFDLYSARARRSFIASAAEVTAVDRSLIETDLGKIITELEPEQERRIKKKMQPVPDTPELSDEDKADALELLRDPKLFDRILTDFEKAGVVGEDNNKLLGYLIAVSRKLDKPLSGQIHSRSAAGKSSLMNAILDFVPPEDKHVMTSLTAQALFYMSEEALNHKVLAVAEDEGSAKASYPLKILGSENELTLAVTVRDPDGGMPQTSIRKVKASVSQLTTSTKSETDYELGSRYLILTVDESREQTQRIYEMQRAGETIKGLKAKLDKERVIRTHHNAQRMLRTLFVHNPFAEKLKFPDDRLRLRRDNPKYLGLIRTVAFMRQYQKAVKTFDAEAEKLEYIEVDQQDIKLANQLAATALSRSMDELTPPVRSFLMAFEEIVSTIEQEKNLPRTRIRLTRREIRDLSKWSVSQVRDYLKKLVELEFVVQHKVQGYTGRYTYELVYSVSSSGKCQQMADNVEGQFDIATLIQSAA